jgi:hypothetical protein
MRYAAVGVYLVLIVQIGFSENQSDLRQQLYANLRIRNWDSVVKFSDECLERYGADPDVGFFIYAKVLGIVARAKNENRSAAEMTAVLRKACIDKLFTNQAFSGDLQDAQDKFLIHESGKKISYYGYYSREEHLLLVMDVTPSSVIRAQDYVGMLEVTGTIGDIYVHDIGGGYLQTYVKLRDGKVSVSDY